MTWAGLEGWIQFFAAAATIFATPWIVDAFKYFFRRTVILEIQLAQPTSHLSTKWLVRAKNKTGDIDQRLIVYARSKAAKIKSAALIDQDDDANTRLHSHGRYFLIEPKFWPPDRPLSFWVEFDRSAEPNFRAPSSSIKRTFVSRNSWRNAPRNVLIVARLRVIIFLMQFCTLTAIALLRLIYLGFSQG